MITYNEVYEAARKERYSDQLQKIPKNFVSEISKYLKEKKEVAAREEDVFSDVVIKTKKQVENSLTLFKELMRRRREKILRLVMIAAETGISKQDFDNMLTIEKEMFEEIMKGVEIADKKINELLGGKEVGGEQKNDLIVFLNDVSEFVGMDGGSIGPFEKGDIANIPLEVARILVGDKKAEYVLE